MGPVAMSLWVVLAAQEPGAAEVVAPAPGPVSAPVPAPVVARPAAPVATPIVQPIAQPIAGPPSGKWMRVSGGLAIGLGALLGVAALASYAVTDGLEADDVDGRRALQGISLGLGIAAVAHLGAGVPLLVVGKQRKRRHDAWSRRIRCAPRFGGGPQGVHLGLTLRF